MPGLSGEHGNVVVLSVGDLERVRPPRRDAPAVAREHEHVMTVQVHRVRDMGMVREAELDRLAAAQHVHRHSREGLAVDRPLPAEVHASLEEAEPSSEVDGEVAIEPRRHRSSGCAVRRGIEVRAEPRVGDGAVARVEHESDVLVANSEAHGRARHVKDDVVTAAGRDSDRLVVHEPTPGLVTRVDRDDPERRAREREPAHRVGRVGEPQAHGRSRSDMTTLLAVARAEQRVPADRVSERNDVHAVLRFARRDDERSVQTTLDLARGVLVRVVPVRAGLVDPEAVDVRATRVHGVLRHTRHAVLGVRDVDSVPMDRHALVYVAVDERHLDELARTHAELGAGRLPLNVSARTVSPDGSRTELVSATSRNVTSGGPSGPSNALTGTP